MFGRLIAEAKNRARQEFDSIADSSRGIAFRFWTATLHLVEITGGINVTSSRLHLPVGMRFPARPARSFGLYGARAGSADADFGNVAGVRTPYRFASRAVFNAGLLKAACFVFHSVL